MNTSGYGGSKKFLISSIVALVVVGIVVTVLIMPTTKNDTIVEDLQFSITAPERADLYAGAGLKCANLPTLRERTACRLDKDGTYGSGEELEYLPEECRSLSGESEACIERYSIVQICWKQPIGEQRVSCVKNQLQLGDIAQESITCGNDITCTKALKDKVYSIIKWRLYDFEQRAHDFHLAGTDEEEVIEFVMAMETKKINFNEAGTFLDRKDIILESRDLWNDFVEKVRLDNLNVEEAFPEEYGDGLDQALQELQIIDEQK